MRLAGGRTGAPPFVSLNRFSSAVNKEEFVVSAKARKWLRVLADVDYFKLRARSLSSVISSMA